MGKNAGLKVSTSESRRRARLRGLNRRTAPTHGAGGSLALGEHPGFYNALMRALMRFGKMPYQWLWGTATMALPFNRRTRRLLAGPEGALLIAELALVIATQTEAEPSVEGWTILLDTVSVALGRRHSGIDESRMRRVDDLCALWEHPVDHVQRRPAGYFKSRTEFAVSMSKYDYRDNAASDVCPRFARAVADDLARHAATA